MSLFGILLCTILMLLFKINTSTQRKILNPCDAAGYQGDVALSDGDLKNLRARRSRRAATNEIERKWPFGVVPYEISNHFDGNEKAVIQAAMRHWEVNTCLSFVDHDEEQEYALFQNEGNCGNLRNSQMCTNDVSSNAVEVESNLSHKNLSSIQTLCCTGVFPTHTVAAFPCTGCCSYVGRMGDEQGQGVNLADNCIRNGTVAHEIGHLIGFWHEHTRPDRDRFVEILKRNVLTGELKNFRRLGHSEVNSFHIPYDFGSIMHYSKTTFSKNGYDITIRPLPGMYDKGIGQRLKLSPLDIKQANLLYKCASCGRTMTESNGNFSFLTSDLPKMAPTTCVWRIFWTAGEKLHLKLSSIYFRFNCKRAYLEIRDGKHQNSRLFGRYCKGKSPPKEITSTNSSLWIKFHYGYRYFYNKRRPVGFKAEYKISCGGTIKAKSGELMSPNYPDNYKPNQNCEWNIVVPEGGKVAIKFQLLDLEESDKCEYDHVELLDGVTGIRKAKVCGTKLPKKYILSSKNKMRVRFNSDADVHHKGFFLQFITEYDECKNGSHNCSYSCKNTVGGYECSCGNGQELHSNGRDCERACGRKFRESEETGTILSPSYPDNYPINRQCSWVIRAKEGYKIALKIVDFDLEDNKVCNPNYDYLQIKAGKLNERYCGAIDTPRTIESESNEMTIDFNSDNTVAGKGFKATYTHIRDHCATRNGGCSQICTNTLRQPLCSCKYGYILDSDKKTCKPGGCFKKINSTTGTGSILSPDYPNSYQSNEECKWKVMTLPGQRFNITFESIQCDPEKSSQLAVKWVVGRNNVKRKEVCKFGQMKRINFLTEGNIFHLNFKLGKTDQGAFKLSYTTVCGGNVFATRKVQTIFSHIKYGSQNYPENQNCIWKITARGRKKKVELRFKKFQLEDKPCNYDFVKVYDGEAIETNLLNTECGHAMKQSVYRSSGRTLIVHFKSDDSVSATGFEAEFVKARRIHKRHHIRLFDPFKDGYYKSKSRDLYF